MRRLRKALEGRIEVATTMSDWTANVIARWQTWRNEDHEDNAVISRSDVITLLTEIERLRAELAAVRHHLEAAYEAMGVPLIMSRPLSCYINDLRKELAAERAARVAVGSPVRQEGEA